MNFRTANDIANELRQHEMKLSSLHGRGKVVEANAKTENRDFSLDEQRSLDRILSEFDQVELKIRELRAELSEAERCEDPLSAPLPRQASPSFPSTSIAASEQHYRQAGARAPQAGGIGKASVLAMFSGNDTGGFRDFGQFAQAVAARDPRLFRNAGGGMSTQVGADGGFAVPTSFLSDLMQASLEQEVVRPRCRVVPMPTGTAVLPRFNTNDRSAGVAGMSGLVTAEGATATTQKAKIEQLSLSAKKHVVLVPTTMELLEDAGPTFGTLLADHMAAAMAASVDDQLLLGSGAGQALGIVNAPATVEVAKESGQAAATIEPANLSKMVARLAPGSFGRAVWIAHSSALAQLFTLHQRIANQAANDWVGGFAPGWFSTGSDGTMQLLSRPLICKS